MGYNCKMLRYCTCEATRGSLALSAHSLLSFDPMFWLEELIDRSVFVSFISIQEKTLTLNFKLELVTIKI